jgi:hypothetical protein
MRSLVAFLLLVTVNVISRALFRLHLEWVGVVPKDKWKKIRIIAVLNHTSLYEPLLAGYAPFSLLWSFARHGVLPVAEKTMRRSIGLFFRMLVRHVVMVTRQRDHTWDEVLNSIDSRSVVIILPEGRMVRRDGLDADGNPMTVRGGIADILQALPDGRMLIVYSGGLHHIQAPGELVPRPFRTIRARMEIVEIAEYKAALERDDFRGTVIRDLTQRRNQHCPASPKTGQPLPGADHDPEEKVSNNPAA